MPAPRQLSINPNRVDRRIDWNRVNIFGRLGSMSSLDLGDYQRHEAPVCCEWPPC
jgi:hypothetical protein